MNRFILLYYLVLLSVRSNSKVWQFGHEIEDSVVLASYKSEGPVLERFKRVDFYLPSCYYGITVKAEVYNPVMKPKVSFNWHDNSITFQYKAEREGDKESISNYHVVVKGKYEKKCNRGGKLDKAKIRPDFVKPLPY